MAINITDRQSAEPEPAKPISVAILTFVLQEHHCIVVEDWISFLGTDVSELVVHVGKDPSISVRLIEVCEACGISLSILGTTSAQETTQQEAELLAAQFDATQALYACVVRLDTLPFQSEKTPWLRDALDFMAVNEAAFLTGAARPFRADRQTDHPMFMLTQRISNCFLIIEPETWRNLQSATETALQKYGRFAVEGVAEDNLASQGIWGVRLLNSEGFRVFHCQEWSERLLFVRDNFHKGKGIHRYLSGFQDDFTDRGGQNYMEPQPPILRRLRIKFGLWRRKLFKSSN